MSMWSRGTGIAQLSGAAPLKTVQLTAIQGAVPSKVLPQLNWCLRGDITIAGAILFNKPSCEELAEVEGKISVLSHAPRPCFD